MMTMRKILAIVLCVCAVLCAMSVAASAAYPPPDAAPPTVDSDTPGKPLGDQIMEWWESIKPWLEPLYMFSFQGLSKMLVAAFQGLLALVGLNFWTGGLFGFLS